MLAERLPESIAFAAFEFINGPLLDNPYRVGRRLLAPLDDRYSARRDSYWIGQSVEQWSEQSVVSREDHLVLAMKGTRRARVVGCELSNSFSRPRDLTLGDHCGVGAVRAGTPEFVPGPFR